MTWGMTPRQSIEAACRARGADAVIAGCITLIEGGDTDPGLIIALAGPGQERFLDKSEKERYWLRVWGVRGLLWALSEERTDERTETAVINALGDAHWRVREMAAKLAARHRLDSAQPALAGLLTDDNERVRAAAARAVRVLQASESPESSS
ncbi:HEAT repeat domain-containing protein [Actinoplanes sp. NPDC051343]|uniref:HEAT repeat domain-containing protein n=1 Tax=Actinoplanes sp. NPDC051343 TaxID=3363906 RepID=UPI0037B02076